MSLINVGSSANDGTGDPLRTAFQKINANLARFYFANVGTAIEDDGILTYTAGATNRVAEGDILWTQEGFRFSVLDSGASDYDRATNGGVKLLALPDGHGVFSVLQFGASVDKPNNAPMIQKALDRSDVRSLSGPVGIFEITEPLWLSRSGLTISGPASVGGQMGGSESTFTIRKTTSTTASHNGSDINAAFVIRRSDNGFLSHLTLENMAFSAPHSTVEYGIWAPNNAMHFYKNLSIDGFRIGYYTNDSWCSNWHSVLVTCRTITAEASAAGVNPSVGKQGWPDDQQTIAVVWDGEGSGAGPVNSFTSCWVRNCHIGWFLKGMGYSAFNSCGADQISENAWYFEGRQVAMNGCGTENAYINPAIIRVVGSNAYLTINSFQSDTRMFANPNAPSGSLDAGLRLDAGANVVMNGSRLRNFRIRQQDGSGTVADAQPGETTARAVLLRGGASLVTHNSAFASNGSTASPYAGGSTWVETINGETRWKNANGQNVQGPPS